MTRVLLITAYYPPGYQVGYARVTKFEKYLPQFGFTPYVLTMRSNGILPDDRARRVWRAFDAGTVYLPFTRRYLPSPRHKPAWPPGRNSSLLSLVFRRLREWGMAIAVPDLQITWLPAAIWAGLNLVQNQKIDVIFSTSPPETSHLIALAISALTGKPWVTDFRDGWLFEPLKTELRQAGFRQHFERYLEHWVIIHTNAVVSASQALTDYFQYTYAACLPKFHTITNGYDPEEWQNLPAIPPAQEKCRIVNTGAFAFSHPNLDITPFLKALKQLSSEAATKLEILFLGELTPFEKQTLNSLRLSHLVKVIGQVSKPESLAYQRSADVLLLIAGQDRSPSFSKLYEYLYSGKPILTLSAPETTSAQIVKQTGAGEIVDYKDSDAIAHCLSQLVERWQNRMLVGQRQDIERYDRRYLTQQLAEVLNAAIATRQHSITG